MAQSNPVNGVDVQKLRETIEQVRRDPSLARFRFRATNAWDTGGHNQTTIEGFWGTNQELTSPTRPFRLEADEPEVLLGQDRGPNPVEHLLNALAACMTTAMAYHAAARGLRLHRIESKLEGELDLRGLLGVSDEVRKGYRRIDVTFRVEGDGTPEQLAELTRFSPVLDVVSNGTEVNVSVEKIGAERRAPPAEAETHAPSQP